MRPITGEVSRARRLRSFPARPPISALPVSQFAGQLRQMTPPKEPTQRHTPTEQARTIAALAMEALSGGHVHDPCLRRLRRAALDFETPCRSGRITPASNAHGTRGTFHQR